MTFPTQSLREFISTVALLRSHERLATRRSVVYTSNRWGKLGMYIALACGIIYLLFIAIMLAMIANEASAVTPVAFFTLMMPFVLALDYLGRLIIKQTPGQRIKPYLLLPLRRQLCTDAFLVSEFLSWGNLFWFTLFVPYCLMAVVFAYGLWPTLHLLVFLGIVMLINSQFYLICRSLTRQHLVWWLLPIGTLALITTPYYIKVLSAINIYGNIGDAIAEGSPLPLLFAIVALIAIIAINRKVQQRLVLQEVTRESKSTKLYTQALGNFHRLGTYGNEMMLELRLVLRCKSMRLLFITALGLVLLLSLVMAFTPVYDSPGLKHFFLIYNVFVLGEMLLLRAMSVEMNYLNLIMMQSNELYKILVAKYRFCGLLNFLAILFMLPIIIVGKVTLFCLLAYTVFASGVGHLVLLLSAIGNKQKLELTAKFSMSGGNRNNYLQLIAISVLFTVTMFLFMVLEGLLAPWLSNLIITLIGLVGVAFHPLAIRSLTQALIKRKYSFLDAVAEE